MLDGQVAIMTAAAGAGIGHATARRFAEEGAEVVVTDVHSRRVREAAESMQEAYGRPFLSLEVDVTNLGDVKNMVKATLDRYGRIDILVNNAARNILSPVVEMTDETWHLVINTCLNGTFYCTRAVLPQMIQQRSGKIVSLASVAGWRASARQAHYAAAKAGIMAFTRAVAAEVGQHGIRVNAVAPTAVPNPFLARIYPPEVIEKMGSDHPFGRGARTRELADVILFLCSDLSSYMTGEVISVSGMHP